MASHDNIAIIGVGRLGGALALALSKKGYAVRQFVSRSDKNARRLADLISPTPEILISSELGKITSDIIFITTPDAEIRTVAAELAGKLPYQPFVFHTSGALSSAALQPLSDSGCRVASFHPLVAISESRLGAERFRDAFFCVEGDAEAVELAQKIVADLEGKAFSVATEFKTLYHAAAVMASGHLVALFSVAVEALTACGLNECKAREILFPLVKSNVDNLSGQAPAQALTGTFSRADVETLKNHLETLHENVSAEVVATYLQLGMRSLHLAQQQGADAGKLAEMRRLLMEKGK